MHDPHDSENLVLNLYALGGSPKKDDPYSVFVGLHAILLLSRDMHWGDVKSSLERIGYHPKHVQESETWLKSKDVIKEVAGVWRTELPIARGHWALLKERAYTDNMAVACAIDWKCPEKAAPTDPLRSESLLSRCTGSIWFLQEIWKAECALSHYPSDSEAQKRCGDFSTFSASREELQLPSITHLVAKEYLNRMNALPKWPRLSEAITTGWGVWDQNHSDLTDLVEAAARPDALNACC